MKRLRLIMAIMALAILGVVGGAALLNAPAASPPDSTVIGGPFELTNQNGARVDEQVLTGKWTAVYFGYTYCPDVCPTILAELAQAIDQLGDGGRALQVLFVTVDPARDTPAHLRAYLSNSAFPRGTIGLTGAPGQIRSVARAYRVYFSRRGAGPNYSMDHTSIIYLMDPRGRFVRPIAPGTPADMAAQITAAMSGG